MTLTLDFEGHVLKNLYHSNKRADWYGTKRMWVDRMLDSSCDFKPWPHPWPSPWIIKVKFLIAYSRNGKVDRLGIKEIWVRYNVGCTMGLLLGHSALQIDRPSNGSMWNSDSFQPHGWPSTQPGTCTQPCPIVHTAVPPLFTQPCLGKTMSTTVCIYVAGLCASCPAV